MSDSIFPTWGKHERMGHRHIIGLFEPFAGTSMIARVPELPADPLLYKKGSPASVEIVPMDGPAFYGFTVLSEEVAMGLLLAGRETDWEAREAAREHKRLTDGAVDAVEVRASCAECGAPAGKHEDDCSEAPF